MCSCLYVGTHVFVCRYVEGRVPLSIPQVCPPLKKKKKTYLSLIGVELPNKYSVFLTVKPQGETYLFLLSAGIVSFIPHAQVLSVSLSLSQNQALTLVRQTQDGLREFFVKLNSPGFMA